MSNPDSSHSCNTKKVIDNPFWYKGLTLIERLTSLRTQSGTHQQPVGDYDAKVAGKRLQRWKAQKPFSTGTYFADRLTLSNTTEKELLTILGESEKALQERARETPIWLLELAATLENYVSPDSLDTSIHASATNDVYKKATGSYTSSFLGFIHPFIESGKKRLRAGIATLPTRSIPLTFDPDTLSQAFSIPLLEQLSCQLSRTLLLELHVARLEGRLQGNTPEEQYHDFVQKISQKDGIRAILEEYVVLARLLVATIENWVNSSLEFLHHLCADWNEICQMFLPDEHPEMLVAVEAGTEDLSRCGRRTLRLTFDSGFQLIYKPKSMAVDVHFQELLIWLNEHGNHPAFLPIKVLDRGTHGWSEFVTAYECLSEEGVARFYERQGGYLALFYALGATDVRFKNLIAAGEHPIMTDPEALFHSYTALYIPEQSQPMETEMMNDSILRTGFVPQKIWGDQEHMKGDVNGSGEKKRQQNRPTYAGNTSDVLPYCDELLTGFSRVYRLLMKHREEVLQGPIAQFAHDEIRAIIHPIQTYAELLQDSYHPDLLRNALDRDRFFDHLWAHIEYMPQLARTILAEQDDLHRGNIPLFTTRPHTRDIYTSRGERIADFLDEPGLVSVKKRLQQLSEQDLLKQGWLIQGSLDILSIHTSHTSYTPLQLVPSQIKATPERLMKVSCMVGDRLCEQAFVGRHRANWMDLTYTADRGYRFLPANADLYAGVSGITFFLSYLGASTGNTKYTTLAKAALLSVREQVKELKKAPMVVGAFNGWGSFIYLYSHLGTLWNEPELFSEAEEILKLLPEQIEMDIVLDVMGGSAGCISSLTSLYQVAPSPDILALAIQCGDKLIDTSQYDSSADAQVLLMKSDKSSQRFKRPLTGFSHGAAGIALSLLKVANISGEERFRQAALTAMAYERSVFSPEKQNWPDFRDLEATTLSSLSVPVSENPYMSTWCHGAAGIGLARLVSLKYIDDKTIREEIAIALKTTLNQRFGLNHSLCHGDLGNLETLLTASQILDDSLYHEHVERLTAMILESIETYGWRTGMPMGIETPGLMLGIAGIGYELLRLAEPEKVPCILTLEHPIRGAGPS